MSDELKSTLPRVLREQIARQRDQVIDLEIVVDDTRRALDRAGDDFRSAVRERDRGVRHLAQLIDLHHEEAA